MHKFNTKCPDCLALYTLDETFKGKVGVCQFCRKTFLLDPVAQDVQISDFSEDHPVCAPSDKTKVSSSLTVFSQDIVVSDNTSFSVNSGIEIDFIENDIFVEEEAAKNDREAVLFAEEAKSNSNQKSKAEKNWEVGDIILGVYEVRSMPNGLPYAEGGVGLVHRVYHREWDIELAVKSPKPTIFQTEIGRLNYERECKTWIDLGLHPNIVTCYLARRIDGIPRLFAELMLDGSLSDWVRNGRLYQGEMIDVHKRIFDIAIQFAWGLDYAHRQGLLHLDIKPANVMISGKSVKVTDFGLSRAVAAAVDNSEIHPGQSNEACWEGMTPGYCSPEQYQSYLLYRAKNNSPLPQMTAQSDIWSWAISVLTMYYGRPPCKKGGQTAGKTFELFLKIPTPAKTPAMPNGIIELLRHCFQLEPENRPRSMAEISDRLINIYRDVFRESYPQKQPIMTASTAESLNNRAASLIDLGELKQAELLFGEVVRMHTWHPQASYNKIMIDWRTGKITDIEATHQIESLTNLRPDDATSWYALAQVQRERGNIEDAYHAMQRVVELEPKKEYRRHNAVIREMLTQNTRCIERFRVCPLERPFVFLSEDESLILFAVTPEMIGIYQTETGALYTKFRKNRIGSSSMADSELLFAQTPTPEKVDESNVGIVAVDALSQQGEFVTSFQSGLLYEMLHADKTFSVLSNDTNWELYRTEEPDRFFLRKTHEDAQPIAFQTVRWNVNEEHFRSLLTADSQTNVKRLSAVQLTDGVPMVITARVGELPTVTDSEETPATARPYGLIAQRRGRLRGHEGTVLAAHTTPDGNYAVTGGSDKTVRIWELNSRHCVRTFRGGEGYVRSLYISKNRRFMLSLADQSLLKIWDTNLLLNEPYKLRAPIMLCLVASSEVVSQNQSELAETCRQAKNMAAEGNVREAIASLEKAKKIAGWESLKKDINQWDLVGRFSNRHRIEGALCNATWHNHGDIVSSVAMSMDGKTAVSSGRAPTILVWDLLRGCCVRELTGHTDWVRSVDVTSDGRFVVSAGWDQTVRIWNVDKGELIRVFEERLRSTACVAFSPSARSVAVTTAAGQLYLFDSTNGKVTAFWSAHGGTANTLRFSRDGRHIVTGGDDGKVMLWDVAERGRNGRIVARLPAPAMAVWPVTTLSHVAVASQDGLVRLCRVDEDPDREPFEWAGHLAGVTSLIMTPDDRWLVTGSKDKTIRIWEWQKKAPAQTLKLHSGTVSSLALDFSATRLLSTGEDETVRSWNLDWGYEFPGWQDETSLLDDYVRVLMNVYSPKANLSAIQSGVIPTTLQLDERLFRAVRAELEFRGFGWIKPEAVWHAITRCADDASR